MYLVRLLFLLEIKCSEVKIVSNSLSWHSKDKTLAITGDVRSPLAPNVPTFKELGYPDLNLYVWAALFAPAGTPDILIQKLSIEINKALKTTEVIEKFKAMDFTPLPSTPEELTIFVRNDSRRWAEAVKLSGFKASE